jgi:hypothetical protein
MLPSNNFKHEWQLTDTHINYVKAVEAQPTHMNENDM